MRMNLEFGWGTWIRTKIDRVRVGSSTVELSPKGAAKTESREISGLSCGVAAGLVKARRLPVGGS